MKENALSKIYGKVQVDDSELILADEICIFLDTNIILNIFEFGSKTVDSILEILQHPSIAKYIHVTHHSGLEFYGTYETVRKNARSRHDLFSNEIKNHIKSLNGLAKKYKEDIDEGFLTEINTNIESGEKIIELMKILRNNGNSPKDNNLIDRIASLLEGRISDRLSDEKMLSLLTLAPYRYDYRIPPGYKDSGKTESQTRRYGDLIIWFEMLEFAKNQDANNLLFVTDDVKSDWWSELDGGLVPHHKLVRECHEKTGSKLSMMTFDNFLKWAFKQANVKPNEDLINSVIENSAEVKSVSQKMKIDSIANQLTSYNKIIALDELIKLQDNLFERHISNMGIIEGIYRYMKRYVEVYDNRFRTDLLNKIYDYVLSNGFYNTELFIKSPEAAESQARKLVEAIRNELDLIKNGNPANSRVNGLSNKNLSDIDSIKYTDKDFSIYSDGYSMAMQYERRKDEDDDFDD